MPVANMNSYIPSLARGLKSVAKKVDGLCHDKLKAADRKEAKSGALMHEVVAGLPMEHKQLGRAQIETKVNPRADAHHEELQRKPAHSSGQARQNTACMGSTFFYF